MGFRAYVKLQPVDLGEGGSPAPSWGPAHLRSRGEHQRLHAAQVELGGSLRSRGEHAACDHGLLDELGSPPLARRALCEVVGDVLDERLTSARAEVNRRGWLAVSSATRAPREQR